ncbi:hypothetical protein P280DRAFT_467008 [Massarina eburnea CBS 473.64]|uniref:DUF7704 domain-containing protein n=1 Tax=Massarina eburnea CBS 473.64 TaxID=1395130 RepID=A0A6A6SDV5_9PLEO|nr:hypothetical protein P280DRAFT_467008 [Massarina eburnea CBS 473.64]
MASPPATAFSTATSTATYTATLPSISLVYRVWLLYLEPVFALNGAALCVFAPALFLNTFSPHLTYAPSNQIIYDQLAATYALFAFNQAIVLRVAQDIRVWKAILGGILMCDTVHLWAGWKVMVQEGNTWPMGWRAEDWVAVLLLVLPGAMRVAFLMDVGIGKMGAEEGELGVQGLRNSAKVDKKTG